MMCRNKSIACLLICASALSWGALLPEDQTWLERTFAPTNRVRQVDREAYVMLSNCWFSLSAQEPARARELQYNILTNVCRFKSGDVLYWHYNGVRHRASLFRKLCEFRCTGDDAVYLEHCADFLGREMVQIPERVDLHPRTVSGYNCCVDMERRSMLKWFSKLVGRFERTLEGEEIERFRADIIRRAKLTEEEQDLVFGSGDRASL